MFQIPFLTRDSAQASHTEDRRAKFGCHRFAVPQDLGKEIVCLYYQLSSAHDSIFIQGEHNNQGFSHSPQATLDAETLVRRPATLRTAHVVSGFVIVVFIAIPAIVAMTIGNFAFEVTSSTDSALQVGIRLFTDKFDHFIGPRLQHSVEIGHLNMEVSFGFHSDSASAHNYANVALGARSIPGLTSSLYSPPLRLDITRVDKTFWKSFGPRPTIHPPEMALSGSNNPGQHQEKGMLLESTSRDWQHWQHSILVGASCP